MAMFALRSLDFGIIRYLTGSKETSTASRIDLPSVEIHEIEENPERRARTLKHLIKANHINHSIIYHNLRFHNHAPHVLGSAYLLGASHDQLNTIYDSESSELEPWKDSPGEISVDDWKDFLGKRDYQRAFVDFYEDQLAHNGYDWRDLFNDYLFEGKEPLINNMIAGLGHPLIHLGYAYELSCRTVAIEALALVSCFYNDQHKYLDDPSYTKPSTWTSTSPLEILTKVSTDTRFDNLFKTEGEDNHGAIFDNPLSEALLLEYWNSWSITDPTTQFAASQHAAAALLVASSHSPNDTTGKQYDFFLVHLLTSSHAIRIILPLVSAKHHLSLVRQWWLFVLSTYISQLRPKIDVTKIEQYDVKGRSWDFVEDTAVNGRWNQDAHFVKGCRALKEAAKTWGDDDRFYLKAAVKFADEFNGWGGFGSVSKEDEEYYKQSAGYVVS